MEASIYVGEGDDMDLELAKCDPVSATLQITFLAGPSSPEQWRWWPSDRSFFPDYQLLRTMGFPASIRTLQRQNEGLLTS